MAISVGICGILLIMLVLWEGFETIILPRRVTRRFRLTRFFYRRTWLPWARLVHWFIPAGQQETWLSFFGPMSLLLLMSMWASGLIVGFALVHWGIGSTTLTHDGSSGFFIDLYLSATTFFTLGLGDVVPVNNLARFLVVVESGMGFGFLALMIGYFPGMSQSFSRREVSISLLDARAGSPPTASEMFRRYAHQPGAETLNQVLQEWERWSAEFLESHLSYPVLAYFRSQHDNQSWLAALTAILDTSALVMSGVEGACARQAELTFAMARHALVDLSLIFRTRPIEKGQDRLSTEKLDQLRISLAAVGIALPEVDKRLTELRGMYEAHLHALAAYFRLTVPPWVAVADRTDNWQVNAWERFPSKSNTGEKARGEHF